MANTINTSNPVVNITVVDEDWTGEQRPLQSIQFNPAASGDVLVVKDGDASGPVIFKTTADGASDEVIKYFHGVSFKPFIDFSACTVSSSLFVIVIYDLSHLAV